MTRLWVWIAIVGAAVAGCESSAEPPPPSPQPALAAGARPPVVVVPPKGSGVKAEQFDLEGTAALVRENRVRDGKQLETEINENPRNRVDVDRDGKRDRYQVVEDRGTNARTIKVRVLPSSKRSAEPDVVAVPIASIQLEPRGQSAHVTARYSDVVVVVDPVVITFDAPIVVGGFCHWVLVVDRPVFVGAAYVIVDVHHHKHKHKHKKFKHKKYK